MSGTAIVGMIVVLSVVIGGFLGLLGLAMRHEARKKAADRAGHDGHDGQKR